MRAALLSTIALVIVAGSALAEAPTISGSGEAPITRDAESVRAIAEQQAREEIVRNLARQTIGAERIGELTPDVVRRLAMQIRSEMIVERSAERVGKIFRVTLSARVDQAWFQSLLDNENISTSADRGGAERQPIFVMIDENTGPARDYQQPSEVVTNYDRSTGAEFRDKSVAAYSEKDRAGSSFSGNDARRASVSGAAGYSDGYGSAAARYRGSAASATSVRGASASSHSVAAIDKTDVAASAHDDEHYYQRITYQTSATTGPAMAARAGLGAALQRYGVYMAASDLDLSAYFKGAQPTYTVLLASPQFKPFLGGLAQRNVAPFFMGGTLKVRDAGRDPATGQAACSGELAAIAYSTSSSLQVAASQPHATATGLTYEDCTAKLSHTLAGQAADEMGPQVQSYWRRQLRKTAQVVAAANAGAADYTLTVRAANLSMAMQADLLDALSATQGVEKQVFLGQSGNQVSFQVRYGGALPLQMALYQKLRGRPGFEQMQPTTEGQSVLLCLSGC